MPADDIDPPTLPGPDAPAPRAIDPEALIAALAAIATDASTAASTLPDDPHELRKALCHAANAAWAAVRRARGL